MQGSNSYVPTLNGEARTVSGASLYSESATVRKLFLDPNPQSITRLVGRRQQTIRRGR